jgi:hypothetical protein
VSFVRIVAATVVLYVRVQINILLLRDGFTRSLAQMIFTRCSSAFMSSVKIGAMKAMFYEIRDWVNVILPYFIHSFYPFGKNLVWPASIQCRWRGKWNFAHIFYIFVQFESKSVREKCPQKLIEGLWVSWQLAQWNLFFFTGVYEFLSVLSLCIVRFKWNFV